MEGICFKTFTFSSRTSSSLREAGGSIAISVRSCSMWFCMTSRIIPAQTPERETQWRYSMETREIKEVREKHRKEASERSIGEIRLTVLVEIAPSPLRAEVFFDGDANAANCVSVKELNTTDPWPKRAFN